MEETRTATVRSIGRPRAHVSEAVRAVKSRPLSIEKHMTVEDAFRVTLLECLAHVASNVPAVVRAREVEGLHQLRVGLRRLHVAFAAFGDEFRTPALTELRKRTKALTDAVAPARDLDVFVQELLAPPAQNAGSDDSFRILRERAEAARAEAWDKAVQHVASADFAVFLDDVAAAAEGRSWTFSPPSVRSRIISVADRRLDEHLVRARKRGRKLKTLQQKDFHRLRIALKKLRYAAEFYRPLYKSRPVDRYLKQLKRMQELLGAMNDVAHVRITLAQLMHDDAANSPAHADLCFAAGLINGWHRARAERLGQKALRRWDRFKRLEPFWA